MYPFWQNVQLDLCVVINNVWVLKRYFILFVQLVKFKVYSI
jgi:hypothetical protein